MQQIRDNKMHTVVPQGSSGFVEQDCGVGLELEGDHAGVGCPLLGEAAETLGYLVELQSQPGTGLDLVLGQLAGM